MSFESFSYLLRFRTSTFVFVLSVAITGTVEASGSAPSLEAGLCSGSVGDSFSKYFAGNMSYEHLDHYLTQDLSPLANGRDYSLRISKKPFLNFAHFEFQGANGTRVVSLAFSKNGEYRFTKVNEFRKPNIKWNLFNPLYKGKELCSNPVAKSGSREEIPAPEYTQNTTEPKRDRFFYDSDKFHENSKLVHVGVERKLSSTSAVRVGPQWESAEGAPDNMGVGIRFTKETDGLGGLFKKNGTGHGLFGRKKNK